MTTGQHLTFDAAPDEMALFMSEGEEQLEILSRDILRLEQEGDTDSDLLQEIFRAVHTLKGSSGAIGHQRMAKLTHAVETVLDQVRHHALPVTTRLADLLLRGLDALRVLLDEVTTCVESDVAIDDLCADLIALASGDNAIPAEVAPVAPEWRIEIGIDATCPLPSVRALQVVLAAGVAGGVLRSDPPTAVIEAGTVPTGATVTLWMTSNDAEFERNMRQTLAKINEVTIRDLASPPGAASAATRVDPSEPRAAMAEIAQWRIEIAIDAGCPLPSARALQGALACGLVGSVTRSDPTSAVIEAGMVPTGAHLTFWVVAPARLDNIESATRIAVERIPEVKVALVTREGSLFAPSTPVAPAPARAAEHPESEAKQPQQHLSHSVRIDVERLDALMNLVGELVIDRTRLARIASRLGGHAIDQPMIEDLAETCRHLARISDDLQDEVMRSRMLPIESVFSKFPRLVRDLAQKVGKKIDFVVEGKDTELDRSVAEQISDPIIHLLRNSIDHGVEPGEERLRAGKPENGQVRLAARHEENQIVIDVEDDGRGINADLLRQKAVNRGVLTPEAAARLSDREAMGMIFASGFSTAEQVSDISGRGVGMDIVRTNVERLNGSIAVETEVGSGTRFTVRLPLTLAIIRALLVSVAGQTYAIPLTSVVEALRIERDEIRAVNGREAIELRGQVLPLTRLAEIFVSMTPDIARHARQGDEPERGFVVAVRWGERRCGLIVDALIGEQEIVIKSLGHLFRMAQGVSGGAVLGDGQVAPILDIPALIQRAIAAEHRGHVVQEARS